MFSLGTFFGSFSQSCSVFIFLPSFTSLISLAGGVIITVPISFVCSLSDFYNFFRVTHWFLATITVCDGSRRATALLCLHFLGGELSSLLSIPRFKSA